jgi:hypothetical protein
MKTLMQIIDFNLDREENQLLVELDQYKSCQIKLSQYEAWLKRTDRLEWVSDYADYTGSHCQETGEYSLDQYWDLPQDYIKHDIYEFIVINFIDPIKDIKNSITKITHEYAR